MLFNCQLDLNYYNFNESIMEKFKKRKAIIFSQMAEIKMSHDKIKVMRDSI